MDETLQVLTDVYVADVIKKLSILDWHEMLGGCEKDEITECPLTHQIDEKVGKVQKLVHTDTY